MATIEGPQTPFPYGGKQRQIQVDLDLHALQAKGLSPVDVVNAISAQNLIAPSGTMKIDRFEYAVETNSAPPIVDELNNLPIKAVNGAVIYIRDVAHVRDGNPPQTNIVRVDGKRAIMMTIMKTGSASTLDIIRECAKSWRARSSRASLPPQLQIKALSDQSIFVRGAINGVVREAIIAACLTAIMILVFLGSWRSTIIIAVSIPLSILCSLSVLSMLHETINIMTLGRHGAGRRHPGGRRHRGHRKHQSLSRIGQGTGTIHPRRLGADCRPGSGLHPGHLHRLRAHVLPGRRGALSLRAHGRGGGLRHAGQLFPLADAGADHGQVPAQGARRRGDATEALQPQPLHSLSTGFRVRL